MTNFVRRVLTFLALLLLFFLGVQFLLWAVVLQTGEYAWYLKYFLIGFESLSIPGQFALSAALILVPLFVLSLTLRVARKPRVLKAQTKDGDEIHITEEAVQRVLHHEIRAIPEVAGLKSRVRNGQGGPRVLLRLWIWAGANVPGVRRRVREEGARALRQLFGLGEVESIQVLVEGLVFRRGRGKKVSRRPTDAETSGDDL